MKKEILLITEEEYRKELTNEFYKRGYDIVTDIHEGLETTIIICYKCESQEMMKVINDLTCSYSLLILIPKDNLIKRIFCDKPTLFIRNIGSDVVQNAFNIFGDINDISFIVQNVGEWSDILLRDVEKFGLPYFNKIKAEEISCRMISFDEQYPVEFKLV